jgi:hypothetical protein
MSVDLRVLSLICGVATITSCASISSDRALLPQDGQDAAVVFVASSWTGDGDPNNDAGAVNTYDILSGTLESYQGCLVETRSKTLIFLTGTMEFHQPDSHSPKQHILSKGSPGYLPDQIIPVGSKFTVIGRKVKTIGDFPLQQKIPERCAHLRFFFTSSGTMKAK